MYLAADSRNKADWLLGVNASYAICRATGLGNNSLGRVQTPVLTAICNRYREKENFISVDSWPMYITVNKDGCLIKMRCLEEFADRDTASQLYDACKVEGKASIMSVSRKVKEIQPPAMYNLTELQKDANRYYNLTAGRTQEIAQKLYERKLISYPRTSSRHVSEDVYNTLPHTMEKVLNRQEFRPYVKSMGINLFDLPRNVIDEDRVTEHPAILITDMRPEGLEREETLVYMLIVGRMLEAFMPPCKVEYTIVDAICAEHKFRTQIYHILEKGWFGIFERESTIATDGYLPIELPGIESGETLNISGCNLIRRKELPATPYTDAELIDYMDTAGLGTVSTRAGIIQTLISRKYIRYSGKYIIPTGKGLYIYETVRGMKITNAALTSDWEAQLARMERGLLTQEEFLDKALKLAEKVTNEIFRRYKPRE